MTSGSDAAEMQGGPEMPGICATSGAWRRLWPAYCIGIGIVLILVGALA